MVFRRLPVVALTALALLAGGCGASSSGDDAADFSGESKAVATTIDDFQDTASSRDAEELCSRYLSTKLIEQIRSNGKASCQGVVEESLKDVDAFDLKIAEKGITVAGTTATVKVTSESGTGKRTDTVTLVKESRRSGGKTEQVWKFDSLVG